MDDRDESSVRRRKLADLREASDAYPNTFARKNTARELHDLHGSATKESLQEADVAVAVAGRIVLRRVMGKASFVTLRDGSGEIQCYLRQDGLGVEEYQRFVDSVDLGDIIGVEGTMMRTNKGELTVEASEMNLLVKSVQPFPDKYHGIEDSELRYRRRYVDLIANERSRRVFKVRSEILKQTRSFFEGREYMEVETPMMHPIPGGALARPFSTHHNALDMDLYLRVAPELYLKRLVVGGYERVFEINRNFRNEGLSTRHNPEFTMLEFYQAYATYEDMIDLTIDFMKHMSSSVCGSTRIKFNDYEIDFGASPRRLTMAEAVAEELGLANVEDAHDESILRQHGEERDIALSPELGWGGVLKELFESLVEHKLTQPTFVTEYPIEVSPLARRNDSNPLVADRFEYFAAGWEIANGFSELNDPDDQEERFRLQAEYLSRGDQEAMRFDADYILALQYGMPPTGGEGIGMDRITMLLTDTTTIRDVLLFPLLKRIEE